MCQVPILPDFVTFADLRLNFVVTLVSFRGYNITMSDTPDGTTHPTPQFVVQNYRSVLRRVVDALRKGTLHARWYFDEMDEEIDKALAPALVRKGAKRELILSGTAVQDEDDAALATNGEVEFLSNLGLAVTAEGIRFRVLRSDEGTVPVPGPSRARQAFYKQQAYFPGWAALMAEAMASIPAIPSEVTNCVLHWETDDEYNLTNVYLALPLAGETTRESVVLLWNEIIWQRHAPVVDGTQVEAETIDQDIYIHEKTGTAE